MNNTLSKRTLSFIILPILILGILFLFSGLVSAAFGLDSTIKQVKTADNPTVYYLDHVLGFKKAYLSEAAYLSYGNKWSDVKVISREELNAWPKASLIKTGDDPAVYYINGDKKILIKNEEEFLRNGFKWEDIVAVNQADLGSYQLGEFMYYGGPEVNENRLEVSLDSTSPVSGYQPTNTNYNLAAIYNFSSQSGDIKINTLAFKLLGVFNSELVKKVRLEDANDPSFSYEANLINRTATFNLNYRPLEITPASSKKIKIYLDLGTAANVENQTIQISLEDAEKIKTDASIIGHFPLTASLMKLINSANILASLRVEQKMITGLEATAGKSNQLLTEIKIKDQTRRDNMIIKSLTFRNLGSAGRLDIVNFILKNSRGLTVAQQSSLSGSDIILNLNNYLIDKNTEEIFKLYADVIGEGDKTIKLEIKEIKATGVSYNYYLPVQIINHQQLIAIKRNVLSVIAKDLGSKPSSMTVAENHRGSVIGLFEIRSDNSELKLDRLNLNLAKNTSAPALDDTIFLIKYDTGEVINSFAYTSLVNNRVSLALNNKAINRRDKLTMAFVTDIPSGALSGDFYRLTVESVSYLSSQNIYYEDNINVVGGEYKVGRSSLYIYSESQLDNGAYTKGRKKVKITSFTLESSAGEDVEINGITFVNANGAEAITYDNGFSNLQFYIGSKKINETIERPYGNAYIFEGFSYKLGAGKRVELKLYTDLEVSLKGNQAQLMITGLNAYGRDSGTETSVHGLNSLSAPAVFTEAKATVAAVSGGSLVAGEKNNIVGIFRLINIGGEELSLKKIVIGTDTAGFSYSAGYSDLEIVNETNKRIGRVAKPVAGANTISLNYKLKAGEELVFKIIVDADSSISIGNINLSVRELTASGKNSKVEAEISGAPTEQVAIHVSDTPDDGEITFIKPINGSISYGFHDPDYPFRNIAEHSGVDFNASQGTSVKAAADGTVIAAVNGGDSGYSYITIRHDNDLETVYGHLSVISVNPGDNVSAGDTIGQSGGQPGTPGAGSYTSGPHLHFEVHLNGLAVDPENYL